MAFDDAGRLECLALTLGSFVHENSRRMLGELAQHEGEAVREATAASLLELDGKTRDSPN